MSISCAACGTSSPRHYRFCPQCGARLPGARAGGQADNANGSEVGPSGEADEAAIRQVSVMFCDMVDSTPLARRLGADAMHRVVGEFFDYARAIVQAHDGVVNQFLGDGFMALFGAPLARADHALAACRAGLAIQAQLAAGGWSTLPSGQSVRLRVGLHCGPVVFGRVGTAGSGAATAIGDTANLAARLQAAAAPGTVAASASILREAGAQVDAAPLGEYALKGVAGKVRVFQVLGIAAARVLPAGPLIGRLAEEAKVRDFLARLDAGKGGLLAIEGEAGIGKSSLVEAVCAQARATGMRIGTAQGQSVGTPQPLRGLREVLRVLHGFEAALPAARRLRTLLSETGSEAELAMRAHALALLGLPLEDDEAGLRSALDGLALGHGQRLAALRMVEAALGGAPVLLVFDDWHAVDHATVELLEHLLALMPDRRFGVVIAGRDGDGEMDAFCQRLRAAGSVAEGLALAPLAADAAREFLQVRLGGVRVAPELFADLLARGAGNPLFLAGLADDVKAGAATALAQSGPAASRRSLPGSIDAVIQARIDRLDRGAQRTLRAAAVLGREFDAGTLAAALGHACDDTLAVLEEDGLVGRGLEGAAPTWRFVHPLTCEVAYASLVADDRMRWHARVADAIDAGAQAGSGAAPDAALAHHRACAGDWSRAMRHLERLAEDAARLAADAEALELYERVLAAADAAGQVFAASERAAIELVLAEALFRLGRHNLARQRAGAALALLGVRAPKARGAVTAAVVRRWLVLELRGPARRTGSRKAGTHADLITRLLELIGNIDYYLDPPRFALDILTMLDYAPVDSRAAAIGLASVGAIADTLSRPRGAARWHAHAAQAGRASGDAIALGYVENLAGLHDYARGMWPQAQARLVAARTHFAQAGHARLWASATGSLYLVLRSMGDPQWMALAEEQMQRARLVGDSHALAWATNAAGVARQYRGDMEGTRALFEAASARYEAIPDHRFLAGALARCAHCHAWEGNFDAMPALTARVEELLKGASMRGLSASAPVVVIAEALVLSAGASHGAGKAEQGAASRAVARALQHGRKCGDESGVDAHRLAGVLAWRAGDRRGALGHWRAGIAMGRARGARRALALLNQAWADAAGDPAPGARAKALFAQSGSAPLPVPPWMR
ncbi:MAG: AAA family ATPase [Burkholderiales bacterium]|nr:AAA family ATPase [Burkholderiales bacterium]